MEKLKKLQSYFFILLQSFILHIYIIVTVFDDTKQLLQVSTDAFKLVSFIAEMFPFFFLTQFIKLICKIYFTAPKPNPKAMPHMQILCPVLPC